VDNVTYRPLVLHELVERGIFGAEPFMLVDVGCGLGLDPAWRAFGEYLHAHAFDPQIDEIERLRSAEDNPNVHYHAALVGLPEPRPVTAEEGEFNPFPRTSTANALARASAARDTPYYETNDWRAEQLTSARVGRGVFLRGEGVHSVDFVKTDTDGGDLEVLESFEEMIRPAGVLGFMVETPYTGAPTDGVHTFHNVDRLLKRHGFLLASMSVNRYSRAALPAPFAYAILAQTQWGQPLWGDLVYLRDAAGSGNDRHGTLSPVKLLKLAALFELFRLPDCAAELLLAHREALSALVDVDALLDLLTPPLHGEQLSYREYVAAFEADPTRFYPHPEPELEPETGAAAPAPTLVQRAKHLAARALGRV
jgi:FkbM family methyltransferase